MNYVFTFSAHMSNHTHYHLPFSKSVLKLDECCARNKNLMFY